MAAVSEVVLYGQPGCHLCEEAEAALDELRRSHAFGLVKIDIHSDPEIARRYLGKIRTLRDDIRTERQIRALSPSLRKDIGWPDAWERRRG